MGIWGRRGSSIVDRELQNQVQVVHPQQDDSEGKIDAHHAKVDANLTAGQVGCQMTTESLRVTKEILKLCNQAQDSGAHTLRMLHLQGDQLDNTERNLDKIHGNLQSTNANLKKIEGSERCCCWCCTVCITGGVVEPKEPPNQKGWKTKTRPIAPITNQPQSINFQQNQIQDGDHDHEIQQNLGQLSLGLAQLKNNASTMNSTVTSQTVQIGRLQNKTLANTTEVNDQTKRTNDLLRK